MAWQDVANQMLGAQAPAVIQYLNSVDPSFDWSQTIKDYVPSHFSGGDLDPNRGSSASIAGQLVQYAANQPSYSDKAPSFIAALPGLGQAQQQQQSQIQQQQNANGGNGFLGLGSLGNLLALGGVALGGAGLAGVGPLGFLGGAAAGAAGVAPEVGSLYSGLDASTLAGADLAGAGAAGTTLGSMISPSMPGAFQVADSGAVSDVSQGLGVGGAGASSVAPGGAMDMSGSLAVPGDTSAGTIMGYQSPGTGLSIADLAKYGGLVQGAGSLLGAGASLLGANKIASASGNAINSLQGMFNVQNAQQAPYRAAGYGALNTINAGIGPGGQFAGAPSVSNINSFLNPAMAFGIGQGVGAVTNLNNASGGAVGGNTLKAITDYATNSALNQYWNPAVNLAFQNQSNIFNRLADVAGFGQTANTQGTQLAGTIAPTIGNTIVGSGAAQAAGTVGAASNLASGANNAMGWYSLPTIMNAGNNA